MSHARHVSWALVDQALVSGVNFLTGILLARFLGLEGYGHFVLLYAALLYANSIQGALMIAPMMSIYPKLDKEERECYLSRIFTLQLGLAGASALLLGALGYALDYAMPDWHLKFYIFPFAVTVIFFQLQDWLRRYFFAAFLPINVLLIDLIAYGGQLIGMVLFSVSGGMTVEAALWILATTYALAFCVGWMRGRFFPRLAGMKGVFKQNFVMARDLLLSGQLQWASSQGVLMVAASFLGPAASGGIRAAQNVVGPVNILYQAMENVIPAKAAKEYANHGVGGLKRYLGGVSWAGGGIILLLCLGIGGFAESLIRFLYGMGFVKYAELVLWQLGYILLGFYFRQAIYFQRAVNSTTVLVFATSAAAAGSIAMSFLLIPLWQEVGVMATLVLGQLLGLWLVGREVFNVIRRSR